MGESFWMLSYSPELNRLGNGAIFSGDVAVGCGEASVDNLAAMAW